VVEKGLGSSLPLAELARRDSALFVEAKRLFSTTPVGFRRFQGNKMPIFLCAGGKKRWRKSGVFLSEKLQPDAEPDAVLV
jgi:hypothetical protein